ncbi:MAG: TIGR00730 family Rossman fold protein [Bacteroidales bacterium]|nr:TIGR00730 family Rossman fold protein [Bacteroidales bacterium]
MNIAVFCASSHPHNTIHAQAARQIGSHIARRRHTLIYGGSNLGLMGEVSGAALAEGGQVMGVIPTLFSEEIIGSQPVSRLVRVDSMAERKSFILRESDLFIALPGGIGTLDEVSEVMVANQLHQMQKPILLLNQDGFYDAFLNQLSQMRAEGMLRTDGGLRVNTKAEEIMDFIDSLQA